MGQITLPVLNRKGYSSMWENSWDNKKQYSNLFIEDLFVDKYTVNMYRYINSNSCNLLDFYKPIDYKYYTRLRFLEKEEVLTKKMLSELIFKNTKKSPSYFSKLYIIKYNNWIILNMFVYVPKVWKLRLLKNQVKKRRFLFLSTIFFKKSDKINFKKLPVEY